MAPECIIRVNFNVILLYNKCCPDKIVPGIDYNYTEILLSDCATAIKVKETPEEIDEMVKKCLNS